MGKGRDKRMGEDIDGGEMNKRQWNKLWKLTGNWTMLDMCPWRDNHRIRHGYLRSGSLYRYLRTIKRKRPDAHMELDKYKETRVKIPRDTRECIIEIW